MDENINQVEKDQFGFQTENPKIPVQGVEIPAGDAQSPQENVVDVTQPLFSEEPVSGQQAETTESSETLAKEDPSRFEYWQSQSDKVSGELKNVREELDYYKSQFTQAQQQSSPPNGQPQGVPQQQAAPTETSLRPPKKPPKPVNYNEVDAYNDPESMSFKYRLNKERFNDAYIGYLELKDRQRETQMKRAYNEQLVQQQAQMLQTNAISHAQNSWGWENGKAQEFVQWATDPNNVTMDHLAKLFEMKDGANRDVVQQKAAEMQRSKQVLTMPRTASVESGRSESPMTDEQVFNAGLMSLKR